MDDSYPKEFSSSGDHLRGEHLKKGSSSSSDSSEEIKKAVEECLSSSTTLDVSRKNIEHLTEEIYTLPNIKYLHLEGNVISMIPEDLFHKLPHLVWLDLRYNEIKALPPGIGYHRQLKTLLLEGNPIKELPTALGNLTSLRALNLRHCPLDFPPKDVIKRGLKSILCFLRDSENGKSHCTEPATSEMPPVENLNLSERLQSSLHLSEECPNEKEKLRFQKQKEEIIKDLREEYLADQCTRASHDITEAGKKNRKNKQLYSGSANLRSNKEMLQGWHGQVKLMEGKKETFRLPPLKSDAILKNAPHAADKISYQAMKKGAEKQAHIPEKMEERLLKVKNKTTSGENHLEQHLNQHMLVIKARGLKLGGTPKVEMKISN